jgi:hypothetical protein
LGRGNSCINDTQCCSAFCSAGTCS